MASPIVLTQLPAVVLPVTVTTGKTFALDYGKLASFNTKELKIIQIISLVHSVFGSVDYRSSLSTLIADSELYMRGISNLNPVVQYTATHWSLGFTGDANLTTDPIAILVEGKRFNAYEEQTLDRIIAYLCSIGPV